MEDRYKFRVWKKDEKKMYYEAENMVAFDFWREGETDRSILMQCTGLKDKNGVLIYEGDVVASCYVNLCGEMFDEIDMDMVGIVSYEAGGFGIKRGLETLDMLCNYCNYSLKKEDYIPNYGVPVHYKNTCNVQVLGNVHENPELLEGC